LIDELLAASGVGDALGVEAASRVAPATDLHHVAWADRRRELRAHVRWEPHQHAVTREKAVHVAVRIGEKAGDGDLRRGECA
jgi:hypothetical protein